MYFDWATYLEELLVLFQHQGRNRKLQEEPLLQAFLSSLTVVLLEESNVENVS